MSETQGTQQTKIEIAIESSLIPLDPIDPRGPIGRFNLSKIRQFTNIEIVVAFILFMTIVILAVFGKWLQTQNEANYGAVPGKVQRAFETEFEGYQVQEVYETETPDKGLTYEITAFKGAKNFMAVYSAKGELLKKEEGTNE